jgi:hypothetical protein
MCADPRKQACNTWVQTTIVQQWKGDGGANDS